MISSNNCCEYDYKNQLKTESTAYCVNCMPKSLLEQLPEIVANGRKQAEKILEGIESRHRVGLQTREVVLPDGHFITTYVDFHQDLTASVFKPFNDMVWHAPHKNPSFKNQEVTI